MKNSLALIPFFLVFGLASCSSAPELKAPADYPRLSVKVDEENTLSFADPKAQFGKFSKIYFGPVKIQVSELDSMQDVAPAEAKTIAGYAEKSFRTALAKHYRLVEQPAPDVLTIRFRIIDIKPTDSAQALMLVPPFALINLMSSKGAFTGSITLAGEFYEGTASKPSAAFVAFRSRPGVDAESAFGKWTAVEKVIDNGAERLANDLNRSRQP